MRLKGNDMWDWDSSTWGGRVRAMVLFRYTEGVQEGCMGVIGFGGKISCGVVR
nr:hypothetical protein [Tanacetum cinerariifolium]